MKNGTGHPMPIVNDRSARVIEVDVSLNGKHAKVPSQSHIGDCGYDLHSTKEIRMEPSFLYDIPTGVHVKMPEHVFAKIEARSSASWNHLLILPGIIDPGYTGEIFAMVWCLHEAGHNVKVGDRLAQLVFYPRIIAEFKRVDALPKTERGDSGFGSTGR